MCGGGGGRVNQDTRQASNVFDDTVGVCRRSWCNLSHRYTLKLLAETCVQRRTRPVSRSGVTR